MNIALRNWKTYLIIILGTFTLSTTSCKDEDGDFNIFTLEDDKKFGANVAHEIDSNTADYPVLSQSLYPTAYGHINRMINTILNSGEVRYKDEFLWETKIIHDDSVLNAFCTPGGYIYVYTGLIKYLESEDQLAGVLGHEIAHADKRHSTDAMTRQYGLQTLLNVVFGTDKGQLARIAVQLKELQYGRKAESEADEFSVIYLYPTEYDARGAARFFEKLSSGGGSRPPVFLSTHPDPEDRVAKIKEKWVSLGSKVGKTFDSRYQDFKNSLPQ